MRALITRYVIIGAVLGLCTWVILGRNESSGSGLSDEVKSRACSADIAGLALTPGTYQFSYQTNAKFSANDGAGPASAIAGKASGGIRARIEGSLLFDGKQILVPNPSVDLVIDDSSQKIPGQERQMIAAVKYGLSQGVTLSMAAQSQHFVMNVEQSSSFVSSKSHQFAANIFRDVIANLQIPSDRPDCQYLLVKQVGAQGPFQSIFEYTRGALKKRIFTEENSLEVSGQGRYVVDGGWRLIDIGMTSLRNAGGVDLRTEVSIKLARLNTPATPAVKPLGLAANSGIVIDLNPNQDVHDAKKKMYEKILGDSKLESIQEILSLADSGARNLDGAGSAAMVNKLEAYLHLAVDLDDYASVIRQSAPNSRIFSYFVGALGIAGTADSIALLTELLEHYTRADHAEGQTDALDVLMSTAALAINQSRELIDALDALSQQPVSEFTKNRAKLSMAAAVRGRGDQQQIEQVEHIYAEDIKSPGRTGATAIAALGNLRSPRVASALGELAKGDQQLSENAITLVRSAAVMKDEQIDRHLITLVQRKETSESLKIEIAQAFGSRGYRTDNVSALLAQTETHNSEQVRLSAAQALTRFVDQDPRVATALHKLAAKDPSGEVRRTAERGTVGY